MLTASAVIDPAFRIAPVRRRLFGSFVEHLGRCVYTGIHEPDHPTADEHGFRGDVRDLVRELGVSTVRYPGGNFVSGYRWEDGVGPLAQRPARLDLAWHSTEPNTVGVDEFVGWCRGSGVEPMLAVNLGTRGIQEAVDLLEYCNVESGTRLSDWRRENGSATPHGIRMWCLGNELDGPWQVGYKTAYEYGRLAAQTARAMRMVDPNLELVACGSSNSRMPTFGSWEATVLEETYDEVDYISAHAYYEEGGDPGSFLASAMDMDYFIESVVAAADYVRAQRRSRKRIHISFDEWNVWYQSQLSLQLPTDTWPVAPRLLEDNYTALDAVVVGSLLICLLRHSDRVHAASQAQLVNVIAPIATEPGGGSWRQTSFHPFAQAAAHAAGDVLRVEPTSPSYETAKYGETPLVDAVATRDEERGEVAVFAVNRSMTEPVTFTVDARSLGEAQVVECTSLFDSDPHRVNSAEQPEAVAPRPNQDVRVDGGQVEVVLPAVSWTVLRLRRG